MKKHRYYYRTKINFCRKDSFMKIILRVLKYNVRFPKSFRQRIINKTILLNSRFYSSKLKKFCIRTGRLRFIINKSKYSRIIFRKYVSLGHMTGFFKNA